MKDISTTYKLLALGFRFPEDILISAFREIPEFKTALQGASAEELKREHTRIFSLSIAGGIPPYETEYGQRDIFMKSQQMADIGGFYRAFGMEVSEEAHERIDYLGAELELMHWLTLKEKYARENGRKEESQICQEAAKKFIRDHLATWAPYFAKQVIQASQVPFYRFLAETLDQFLNSECERLDAHPERILQWKPALPEEEFSCNSCPVLS